MDLKREIAMRERAYPKWVAAGKLKEVAAIRQIAAAKAALHILLELQEPTSTRASLKRTRKESASVI
jgi:hypothetical protein